MEEKIMLNYYDEIRNNILEALEEEEYKELINQANNKDDIFYKLEDRFFVDDAITGNASGSYYMNSYDSRKHCYNFFRDVFESLEEYGYNKELEDFKTFVALVEEGYLDIEDMTLDEELLREIDEEEKDCILYAFEEVEKINFETLDVITRCYYLTSVLCDVLNNYLD